MPEICQAGSNFVYAQFFAAKTDNKQFPIFIEFQFGTLKSQKNFEQQILNFVNFKV